MPETSVIIVNFNGKHFLTDCFQAIENQTFKEIEVILVDNNSTDGSKEIIKEIQNKFSFTLKCIFLDKNTGFTGGNIEGFKQATGDYILLLNPDTIADPHWIEQLIEAANNNPEVGIFASKLINYSTDLIDSAGDGYSTSLKGFKRGEGQPNTHFNDFEYVFGACAGACLYRREMLDEIGFFDEDFFLIHEDTDLNFRAQLIGWKCLYVPTAIVYHKVRSTIGHKSDTAIFYTLRNSDFVRIINVPLNLFIRNFFSLLIGTLTEFFYFSVKHRKLLTYLKAKREVIISIPKLYKKRRRIQKMRCIPVSYLQGRLTSIFEKKFFKNKFKKLLCH
jgi:hypothetical protein